MSKYTTQIRWIIDNFANDSSLSVNQKIEKASPLIFNFEYPMWSEEYRRILEKKILKHYYMKEIGLETLGLWQLFLDERMNLIMPYYIDLYETVNKKYDFLQDIELTEEYDSNKALDSITSGTTNTKNNLNDNERVDSNQTGKSTNKVDRNTKNLNSDFPQSTLNGLDYGTNSLEAEGKEVGEDTQTNTVTNTVNKTTTNDTNQNVNNELKQNTNDKYNKIIKGLNGSRSKAQLITEYRNSLINIDKLIINELHDLFMLIY